MPLPPAADVHLWSLDLARNPSEVAHLLSSEELRRAGTADPRWTVARAGLRALLAGYLDAADPAAIVISTTGKPRIEEPRTPLRFNVSHAGDVALIAVASEREVGVDVEEVRARRDVGRRVLTAAERAAVAEAADTRLALHRHWVAKEALVKATGRGISSMRAVEVALDGPGGPRVVHVAGDEREARRWRLHILEVAPPYVAALVTEGDARVAPLAIYDPLA